MQKEYTISDNYKIQCPICLQEHEKLSCCPMPQLKDFNNEQVLNPKMGILLVAYGSANYQSSNALRLFQERIEKHFGTAVRIAYTSETMRKRLAHFRTKSDSVLKALQKMHFERFTHIAVQSLHLIAGIEYNDVLSDVTLAKESTKLNIKAGLPLLAIDNDVIRLAETLAKIKPFGFQAHDRVIWVGHGSSHGADLFYSKLAKSLNQVDNRVFIGCMDGDFTIEKVFDYLQTSCKKGDCAETIWLMPLLSIIGKHALHDMAGEHEDSWKRRVQNAGYICQPYLHGLVENTSIQDLWLKRLYTAILELS